MTQRRLGDIAFLVHDDGSITRTLVSRLSLSDTPFEADFSLMEHSYRPAHFLFADAVAAADANLAAAEKTMEEALAKVRAQRALIASPEYQEQVLAAPYKHSSGSMLATAFGLNGEVENVVLPESYFMPGEQVFCVVTPKTHNMMIPHYRPHDYFVLESVISDVQLMLMQNGQVHYRIDSYFGPRSDAVYASLDEAKAALLAVFAAETGGSLPLEAVKVVTQQEEKDANKASSDRIHEQVRRQFERNPG